MPQAKTRSPEYHVAAPARLQVMRLTAQEKRRLTSILTSPEPTIDADTRRTATGRFVSRISPIKRVLWTKGDGRPTVLSIADKSYRLGP